MDSNTTKTKTRWVKGSIDGRYSAHNQADILDGNYVSAWALKDGRGWTLRMSVGCRAGVDKIEWVDTLAECKALAEAIFAQFDARPEMDARTAPAALDCMWHKTWMQVFG